VNASTDASVNARAKANASANASVDCKHKCKHKRMKWFHLTENIANISKLGLPVFEKRPGY
jgi:hypothetical protein